MKNYAKVGGRKGKPAYRTPSVFSYQSHLKTLRDRNPRGRAAEQARENKHITASYAKNKKTGSS
ncbi:MAG: hypothetical protein HYV78_00055 [Candidatus Wildermuthbacteria bacterium]|nr:hypothetical protein [Candidatus Wildermuthbacteria bacterium]